MVSDPSFSGAEREKQCSRAGRKKERKKERARGIPQKGGVRFEVRFMGKTNPIISP
jgi:hypothetical protein